MLILTNVNRGIKEEVLERHCYSIKLKNEGIGDIVYNIRRRRSGERKIRSENDPHIVVKLMVYLTGKMLAVHYSEEGLSV